MVASFETRHGRVVALNEEIAAVFHCVQVLAHVTFVLAADFLILLKLCLAQILFWVRLAAHQE